jgi:hypothetical protein
VNRSLRNKPRSASIGNWLVRAEAFADSAATVSWLGKIWVLFKLAAIRG